MRSWIEVAKRTVSTEVSVMHERHRVIYGTDGPPRLDPRPALSPWDTTAEPPDILEVKSAKDREETCFVNVMLSLTVDETRILAEAAEASFAVAGPIGKELFAALEKARAQQEVLDSADRAATEDGS